jgi:hypothetical protein
LEAEEAMKNNIDPGGSRDWEAVEAEKAMQITLTQDVADIGRLRCGSHRGHKYQSGGCGGREGHENNIDPGGSRYWETVEVTDVTNTKVEAVEAIEAEKAMKIT